MADTFPPSRTNFRRGPGGHPTGAIRRVHPEANPTFSATDRLARGAGDGPGVEQLQHIRRNVNGPVVVDERLGDAPKHLIPVTGIDRIAIKPMDNGNPVLLSKASNCLLNIAKDVVIDRRLTVHEVLFLQLGGDVEIALGLGNFCLKLLVFRRAGIEALQLLNQAVDAISFGG